MDTVILSEDEIPIINSFLNEIKEISFVEGVLLSPRDIEFAERQEQFSIEVIYNLSEKYNKKLDNNSKINIAEEVGKFNSLVETYTKELEKISDNKFNISCDSKEYYSLLMSNPTYVLFITLLVNSTILFDRFDDLTYIKETAEKFVDIKIEYPSIENIDCITGNESKQTRK